MQNENDQSASRLGLGFFLMRPHLRCRVLCWTPHCKKDIVNCREFSGGPRRWLGLKHLPSEQRLRELRCSDWEKKAERTSYCLPKLLNGRVLRIWRRITAMKGLQMTHIMAGYYEKIFHHKGVQILEQRPREVVKSHLGKLKKSDGWGVEQPDFS